MNTKKVIYLIVIFSLISFILKAQKLEYGLKFDGIADNREFFSKYNDAETIMGSRVALTLGSTIDSIHQFRGGLSYFYECGSQLGEMPPTLILYYKVEKNKWGYLMGAFPRKENVIFPNAMISEKHEYFNPTVDGLLVKYTSKSSRLNLFADWVSRQDSVRREQFMAGFFGNQNYKGFIAEEYFYLFHNAGRIMREPGVNMEDTMGACFLLGYDFSSNVPLSVLTVKTGILTSAYRNRGNGLGFDINTSSYSEIVADYKGFGVEAYMKFGNQHHFSHGDKYYNRAKNYVRTRFYFTPIKFKQVEGRFMWSLHFTPGEMDNQQQFSLVYYLNKY